jgi:ATP-dependent Clp protease ATP-binding subunit ClpA
MLLLLLSRCQAEKEGPKMMDEYCKDLCAEVRAGRIDPVIGREREVTRVTQILARRTKNNPILLGEPGVGKVRACRCCVPARGGCVWG